MALVAVCAAAAAACDILPGNSSCVLEARENEKGEDEDGRVGMATITKRPCNVDDFIGSKIVDVRGAERYDSS